MNISKDQTILNWPAIKIRELFRKGNDNVWLELVMTHFKISKKSAQSLIHGLEEEGYLKKSPNWEFDQLYWLTTKGFAIRNARAGRPFHRQTAEKALNEFLKRVQDVREDEYYLYKASTVILFGSFLSGNEKVNDVDLVIDIVEKETDKEKAFAQMQARIKELSIKGGIGGVLPALWPYAEVLTYLKSRSQILSLHDPDGVDLSQVKHKVIYQDL